MFTLKKIGIWLGIVLLALLMVMGALWFLNGGAGTAKDTFQAFFGSAGPNTAGSEEPLGTQGNTPLEGEESPASSQKIFLIAGGPVVAATLIEAGDQRITAARYITAEDGHVLEVPLDVPGAYPKVVSQTTIPGVVRALWTTQGRGVLMQYLEGTIVKTVHLSFAIGSSTDVSSVSAALIRFLPDNIADLAVSPDGSQVVYLVRLQPQAGGASGLDGYIAANDGSNAKKLFSIQLSQMTLSWVSQATLLAYSNPAAGIPGIVFAVNTKTGAAMPTLYGMGLAAATDGTSSHVLYLISDGNIVTTYTTALGSGTSAALTGPARAVFPETCVATSSPKSPLLYCAAALATPSGAFINSWYQGLASVSSALLSIDPSNSSTAVIATPGSSQGGEASDITGIALSRDGRYASFVNKTNGKLYGVRLTP